MRSQTATAPMTDPVDTPAVPAAGTAYDDLFGSPAAPASAVVRVGVLGAADAGVPHLRALTASVPGARVVLVHDDGDRRRVAELADHAGADVARDAADVVADPRVDAVVVAGPDPVGPLMDCLEAGVPAYLEPGRVLEPDDVRALVSLEEAMGRRLVQVGFVRRHDPAHLALHRELTDGSLGSPRLLRSVDRGGRPGRAGTGPWPASLLSAVDAVAWLLGDEPAELRLCADGAVDARTGGGSPSLLTVRTHRGTGARIEVHDHAGWGHDVRCEVSGSRGAADLAAAPSVAVRGAGRSWTPLPRDATARFADAHRIGLTAWVRSLHTGRPLGADLWDLHVATTAAAAASTARLVGGSVEVLPGRRRPLYDAAPDRVTARPLVPRRAPAQEGSDDR